MDHEFGMVYIFPKINFVSSGRELEILKYFLITIQLYVLTS